MSGVTAAKKLLDEAIGIIDVGDQRLLAGDGPAGLLPPDISLAEWQRLYICITKARQALGAEQQCTAGLGRHGGRCPNPATRQFLIKRVRQKAHWVDRCDDHQHPTSSDSRPLPCRWCIECLEEFRFDDVGGYNPSCRCGSKCRNCCDAECDATESDERDWQDDSSAGVPEGTL